MQEWYDSVLASQGILECLCKLIYKHIRYQIFLQFIVYLFFETTFIRFAQSVLSVITGLCIQTFKIKISDQL